MKVPIGITRGLTAAALIGLMVLAMLGFRAQEKDMQSLRLSSQEIIYWSTSQGEAELGKFQAILGRVNSAIKHQDFHELLPMLT